MDYKCCYDHRHTIYYYMPMVMKNDSSSQHNQYTLYYVLLVDMIFVSMGLYGVYCQNKFIKLDITKHNEYRCKHLCGEVLAWDRLYMCYE